MVIYWGFPFLRTACLRMLHKIALVVIFFATRMANEGTNCMDLHVRIEAKFFAKRLLTNSTENFRLCGAGQSVDPL